MPQWMNPFELLGMEPNAGGTIILLPDGEVKFAEKPPDGAAVHDRESVRNLLVRCGRECLERFARTPHNEYVYKMELNISRMSFSPGLILYRLDRPPEELEARMAGKDAFLQGLIRQNATMIHFDFCKHFPEAERFSGIYVRIVDPWPESESPGTCIAIRNEIFGEALLEVAHEAAQIVEGFTDRINKLPGFVVTYSDEDDEFFCSDEHRMNDQHLWSGWQPATCISL